MKILSEHYYHALIFESEAEALDVIKQIQIMVAHKKKNGIAYPGMAIKVCTKFEDTNGNKSDPIKAADYQTDRVMAGLRLAKIDVQKSHTTPPRKAVE